MQNVFVFDGQVMLVCNQDKNKALWGMGRKVVRFLLQQQGRIMVALIAWILPFECMLCQVIGLAGLPSKVEEFIWKDRASKAGLWESNKLTVALVLLTGHYTGVLLRISDYRHMAIEMGQKIKGMVISRIEGG